MLTAQNNEHPAVRNARRFFNGRPVERFPRRDGAAVSLVVPLFRSAPVLPSLLRSLKRSDPTPCETIFVSDGDGHHDVPGKLIELPENCGFPVAVNAGAREADGGLICLLNADVQVTPNWLAPMVSLMDSAPDVGAVGNRNLDLRGRIDSVGSEFDFNEGNFVHCLIGRPDEPSPERDTVAERDMITAACLLVRRDVWEELGGFDEAYRIGYFEDSDLCMRIRASGRRILYCPDSVIIHRKGHSGSARHHRYRHNKALFHRRWVETGQVDRFARARGRRTQEGDIVACYIVLNEEEFIEASLESVYPLADRIVIVAGGNDYAVAAGLCGPDKRSTDATVERISSFPDPADRIELIQGAWRDKTEQRNAYAARLCPGDWMLLMDGDEVFFDDGLWRLAALMHRYDAILPGFALFWNDFDTLGTGRWDQFPQVKAVRWPAGATYRTHLEPVDRRGRPLVRLARRRTFRKSSERLYAHYSWVKPLAKLRAKAAYYERQPGAAERMRRNYIEEVFLRWRRDPERVEREFGTHPFGGGGAKRFTGRHPAPIARRLRDGAYSWIEEEGIARPETGHDTQNRTFELIQNGKE